MASIQSATPAMRELVRITAVQRPRADLDVWALYNDALDDFYDCSPVIAAAPVIYSSALGQYRYAVGALPGGTTAVPTPYTVALTCDVDDPMVDDTIAVVKFTAGRTPMWSSDRRRRLISRLSANWQRLPPGSTREVLTGTRADDLLVVTLLVQIERLRLTTLWNDAQSLVPSKA